MEIYIGRNDERLGPFPVEEVHQRLAAGEFAASDLAWAKGTPNWVPLGTLLESLSPGPPPLAGAPPAVPRPQPWQPEVAPRETSGLAIGSLILGILSLTALPIIAGIPAVICGHLSLSEIKKAAGRIGGNGMAVAGLIMGYLSCALLPLIFVLALAAGIALPVFSEVKTRGLQTKSLSNAKQIALACKIYATDNQGAYPKTLDELIPDYLPDRNVFVCPLSPALPVGYDYFGGREDDPPDKLLLVSKAENKGKRIVIRVSGAGTVEKLYQTQLKTDTFQSPRTEGNRATHRFVSSSLQLSLVLPNGLPAK